MLHYGFIESQSILSFKGASGPSVCVVSMRKKCCAGTALDLPSAFAIPSAES